MVGLLVTNDYRETTKSANLTNPLLDILMQNLFLSFVDGTNVYTKANNKSKKSENIELNVQSWKEAIEASEGALHLN